MLLTIFAGLAFVIAVGAILLTRSEKEDKRIFGNIVGEIAAAIAVGLLIFASIRVVPAGTVGVPVLFGGVGSPIQSGMTVMNPLTAVYEVSTRTESYEMSHRAGEGRKAGDDTVTTLSKDGSNINVDLTVLYHIDPAKVSAIYKEVGLDFEDKIVRSNSRSIVRDTVSQFPAVGIVSGNRADFERLILAETTRRLAEKGIVVERVNVQHIGLDERLTSAITAKLQAQQEAAAQEFKKQSAQQQADIRVIEAQGIAKSQQIIQQKLTPLYVSWKYTESLSDLSKSDNAKTIFLPLGQGINALVPTNEGSK